MREENERVDGSCPECGDGTFASAQWCSVVMLDWLAEEDNKVKKIAKAAMELVRSY